MDDSQQIVKVNVRPRASGAGSRMEPRYAGRRKPKAPSMAAGPAEIYLSVFRNRAKTIIFITLLGIAVTLAVAIRRTPYYQAHASLELEGVNEMYLSIRDVNPDASGSLTDFYMQTQARVLASETIVRRALGKPPVENGSSRPPAPAPSRASFSLAGLLRSTGLKQFTPIASDNPDVGRVMQNLEVRAISQTRMIDIAYDDTDPYAAADFTNRLVKAYIDASVERRWEASQNTEHWLDEYVSRLRAKLEDSRRKLESFANDSGLLGTKENDTPAETKLRDLQSELSRAHGERVSKQALYDTVLSSPRDVIPASINPTPLREYQTKLSELRSQRAEAVSTLTPAHYKVQRLDAQIREMEQLLNKEWDKTIALIGSDYQAAERREKLLSDSVQAQTAVIAEQAGRRVHYDLLRSELETNQQVYNDMLQKEKESAVLSATKPTNIHIVDEARPPVLPYKPNLPVYASLGGLSGLFIGLLWAGYSWRRERDLIVPGVLQDVARARELGVIPSSRLDRQASDYFNLFSARKLQSAQSFLFSESFNAVVASLLQTARNGNQAQVLTITSAISGEGKTTIVKNLGVAIAKTGRRVILIDGDLRHPRLSRDFDIANSWGLSDIIQLETSFEDMPLEALVKPTDKSGLFIIPSGPSVASVSSLLHSPRLAALLMTLKQHADTILIDSPPVLAVPDARILGTSSDAVIFVVRGHKTGIGTFLAAAQKMVDDQTPVLGTILNDWDPRRAPRIRDPFQYQYSYRN